MSANETKLGVAAALREFLNGSSNVKLSLSASQARRLGLTRWDIFQAVRKLNKSGMLDIKAPTSEIAVDVLSVLATDSKYASAWESVGPSFDWESILAFIEAILPLILKLIEIFSLI